MHLSTVNRKYVMIGDVAVQYEACMHSRVGGMASKGLTLSMALTMRPV